MGLDRTGLNLCKLIRARVGGFGRVLTVGRQGVHLNSAELAAAGVRPPDPMPLFCDEILMSDFGASECHSIDASRYEGATFVADLNEPINDESIGGYDTVLDFGTLEHVFDVRTAFANVGSLARIGGTIAHVLPANQQCGHGFYQFSPEFFYALYAPEGGYEGTEVYVVRQFMPDYWYPVTRPSDGTRALITSSDSLYVVCITQKREAASVADVQQSDYRWLWDLPSNESQAGGDSHSTIKTTRPLRRFAATTPLARTARQALNQSKRTLSRVANATLEPIQSNHPVRKVPIEDLLTPRA